MRFSITHRIENEISMILLTDKETGTEISVIPSFGCILHSYIVKTANGLFNVIDNYKNLDELKKTQSTSHKSSKLSPFVCRIKEGKYHFNNREYEFKRKFPDGSAIHGLLFDKPFEVTDELETDESASVAMEFHYHAHDAAYPFNYHCLVKYELKRESLLHIETVVLNTGTETMPIADGWHPYFTLGGNTKNWELNIHASQMLEFDDKLIPTGRLVHNENFTKPEIIGSTFLDNCFLLDPSNGEPACVLQNPTNNLHLLFFPIKNYPYLQIYTPPHGESIAIENLSAAPDCFNNQMGLIVLDPGHSRSFNLEYQVLAL